MIDINELRQLAQAATPGPWKTGQYLGSLRQFVINMDVGDKGRGSDVAFTSSAFGSDETVANARLIAAANPAAITELLDRLEAAEKERDELRAKIAGLVPIGLLHVGDYYGEELQDWEFEADQQACDRLNEAHFQREASLKLYALPGAQTQPAPSVPDGWKLMPVEPTKEIYECFSAYDGTSYSNPFDFDDFVVDYAFAIEAAQEAKP